MAVRAQAQEMEKIVQVHFPIPLGINVGRQVHPRKLSCQPLLAILTDHLFVMIISAIAIGLQEFKHPCCLIPLKCFAATLVVNHRLRSKMLRCGDIELTVKN